MRERSCPVGNLELRPELVDAHQRELLAVRLL